MPDGVSTSIFDLDGTLVDSKPGIVGCLGKVIAARQIDYRGSLDRFIGPPVEMWTAALLPNGTEEDRARLANDYRECYDHEGWKAVAVYPGVREMLSRIRAKGVELYVCTSKQEKSATRILDALDLAHYFTGIYGDKAEYAKHAKSLLLFRLLNERTVDRGHAWMIGDRIFDIEAAHANHIRCLAAHWGYGTKEELMSADNAALSPSDVNAVIVAGRRFV